MRVYRRVKVRESIMEKQSIIVAILEMKDFRLEASGAVCGPSVLSLANKVLYVMCVLNKFK